VLFRIPGKDVIAELSRAVLTPTRTASVCSAQVLSDGTGERMTPIHLMLTCGLWAYVTVP